MLKDLRYSEKRLNALIKADAALRRGAEEHYRQIGLQYVQVPQIVGITGACENVDTLFKIGNRLDLPLFFTQTGQLALEQALQNFSGTYTIIHSGRDEEVEDARHLRQFGLTEEEFDWSFANGKSKRYDEEKMYDVLLIHIEKTVRAMVETVMRDCRKELKNFFKVDTNKLKASLSGKFERVTYDEAVKKLQKNGFPALKWGDDLKSEHEAAVVKFFGARPVFIMRYPKDIKFFNMKVSSRDPRVVLSADLILPTSGEAAGSAVREHDGEKLKERLLSSVMFRLHKERGGKYEDFTWYIEDIIMKGRTQPHAGYGIGNERVLQFILGDKDIRNCSVMSLMAKATGDWESEKRGMLSIIQHSKTVLLTIGGEKNKNFLLPVLRRANKDRIILYATERTHKFLDKNGIPTALVHKISAQGTPNLRKLLEDNTFDIIINIADQNQKSIKTESDSNLIRRQALRKGTTLITDIEVARTLLGNL